MIKIAAAIHLSVVNLLIDLICLQEIFMSIKTVDPSSVQHQDPVSTFYAGNSLGNDQFCGIWDLFCESFPDFCIRSSIYRTGRVIQNQDFWLL